MSSITWTVAELQSKSRRLVGDCWRLVEAQHHVSTTKITDNNHEQSVVENIVEETKPRIPEECAHLDVLLRTPFRYGAGYPRRDSRFRRIASARGVYYAAAKIETAVAEMAFYRLLFFAESPKTPWPANPCEYTSFSVQYAGKGVDLTLSPFSKNRA